MSGGRDTGERGQVLRRTWDLGHRRPWTAACSVPDLEPASEGRIKHFQAQGGRALQDLLPAPLQGRAPKGLSVVALG